MSGEDARQGIRHGIEMSSQAKRGRQGRSHRIVRVKAEVMTDERWRSR